MKKIGIALSAALLFGVACKKEEAEAPKATTPKTEAPRTEAPRTEAPKTLTAEERAKWYQDCWAAWGKDAAKFEGCYDEKAEVHTGDGRTADRATVVAMRNSLTSAFPDMTGTPQYVFVNDKTVASVAYISGTNSAPFKMGDAPELPATNKKTGMLMAHIVEMNDAGKVAKEWHFSDTATLMNHLGLSPMPARPVMDKGLVDVPVIVVAKNDETEKKRVEAYQKGVEAFNKHDIDAALADMADDGIWSDMSMPGDVGKKEMTVGLSEFWKAFSDMKVTPTSVWAAGDFVIAHGVMTGTNDGDMPSMKQKKTGKSVKLPFLELQKWEGDKIKQTWMFMDGGAFAMQLGLTPPPGGAPQPGKKPAKGK